MVGPLAVHEDDAGAGDGDPLPALEPYAGPVDPVVGKLFSLATCLRFIQ